MPLAVISPLLGLLERDKSSIFPEQDLVLVPNDLVAFQVRDQVMSQKKVVLNVGVYSFGVLENRLAQERWPELVNDYSRIFFLNRQAPGFWPILGLSGQPSLTQTAELADQLADGLDRLRLAGLSWAEVGALKPPELAKALGALGEKYDQWLAGRDDQFALRLKIIKALEKGEDFRLLRNVQNIHCYHSQRLSPFETKLLQALAISGRRVDIRLDVPAWLFAQRGDKKGLNWGFQRLRIIEEFYKTPSPNLNLEFSNEFEPDYPDIPAALSYASRNIFGPPNDDPPSLGSELIIQSAPTRYQEVEAVGRDLKKAILSGIPARHLAVVIPQMAEYLPAFLDIGRRFGLDFFSRRGQGLAQTGPILALNDLLALWPSRFELSRVVEVLRSPWFNFGVKDFPLTAILESGVSDDRAGGDFEKNLAKAIGSEADSVLRPVLDAVETLRSMGAELSQKKTWPYFLAAFVNILKTLNWPNLPPNFKSLWPKRPSSTQEDVYNNYESSLEEERVASFKYWELLNDLACGLCGSIDAPEPSLEAFAFWLRRAINNSTLGATGVSQATGVWLINYFDLNGTRFEKLYLMGLNDSVFPMARAEGRWWPDEFLKSLAATSLGRSLWTGPQESYQQGEEMFAAALAQAKKVVLSYALYSDDDCQKPQPPSAVITAVEALWPEKSVKHQKASSSPDLTDLRDQGEFTTYLVAEAVQSQKEPAENLQQLLPAIDPKAYWGSLKERRAKLWAKKAEATGEAIEADKPKGFQLDPLVIEKWIATLPRETDGPNLSLNPLTDYATCSRLFWLKRILRLSPPAQPLDVWSSLSQGNLIHGVFNEFFLPFVNKKPDKNNKDLSWSRLEGIFDQFSSNIAQMNPIGREPIFERAILTLKNFFKDWLDRQKFEGQFKILALEWPFGSKPSDSLHLEPGAAVAIGEVPDKFYLTGRVDRLDVIEAEKTIIIWDYKLAFSDKYDPPTKPVVDLSSFESNVNHSRYAMLLYQLAVESHYKLESQAFYDFLNTKNKSATLEVTEEPSLLKEFLAKLWRDLKNGLARPADSKSCEECAYNTICPDKVFDVAEDD
ncbi:MAG: PD-(D/E)XK nuclease family protein [Deltaproteobacteria bacterium]|jgi:hypothetical protein|nr:PD-(D/E)XK nuclease family protein [Deltaproteobacteria bacterium]